MTVLKNGNTGMGIINPARPMHVNGPIRLEPLSSLPLAPGKGDIYYDNSLNLLRFYNGTSWVNQGGTYWTLNGNNITNNNIGNVGIGTSSPTARLHVADSSVVFTGPLTLLPDPTAPPVSGAGTRMMWYPQKAAFRVGYVEGTEWDKDNIGFQSFAAGYNTKASGSYSVSLGARTTASGEYSTTMGELTVASGTLSTSMGDQTRAFGYAATSMGVFTRAIGDYSTSTGNNTTATGNNSATIGLGTVSRSFSSFSVGMYNDSISGSTTNASVATDPLFIIGNGSGDATRRNAMIVLKNGNVGIGTNTPLLSSAGTGLHLQNNTFTQLRLQSTANNAGIELKSASGNLLEIGTNNSSWFYLYDRTISQYKMVVDAAGNVGLGTASPSQKLHVIGNILASGTITSSDLRYKKNIRDISDPLQKIRAIRGVSYDFKTDEFSDKGFSKDQQVGVIAQEVEAVLPQVVFTDKDGYKAVDYSKIVPLLIEGIKDQQKQIEDQKKINDDLLQRIQKLEKLIQNK